MQLFQKYQSLHLDAEPIGLARGEITEPYFCYPVGAKAIGFEGCILCCFVPQYGDMVFAANPESCAESYVYPLAQTFEDFLRLVISCGSANPVEQIVWMSREQFEQHRRQVMQEAEAKQRALIETLCREFGLTPMDDPCSRPLTAAASNSAMSITTRWDWNVLPTKRKLRRHPMFPLKRYLFFDKR